MTTVAEWAQAAVDATRRILGTPSNLMSDGRENECVLELRRVTKRNRDGDAIMNVRRRAGLAKQNECGNCAEYAAVTFDYLMLGGFRDRIEYANYASPGDHSFVILNRADASSLTDCTTWGVNCYIADSWAATVVKSHEYRSRMPSYPDLVHDPEIVVQFRRQ